MSDLIVVGKRDIDIDALKQRIQDAGYKVSQWPTLTRFLRVYGATKFNFTLSHDLDIETVEHAEKKFYTPTDTQPITVNADLSGVGGYLPPRAIRRRRPWGMKHFTFPIDTFFESNRSGDGVDIYICDTGMNADHIEFGSRAQDVPGSAYAGETPANYHATFVTSNAGGDTCGIAKSALLWDVQLTTTGTAPISNMVTALDDSLSHYNSRDGTNRPAVLNMSFGGEGSDSTLAAAVADVIDAGIVCCFPAGNSNRDLDSIDFDPTEADPDSIDVGGTNIVDAPFYTGNYGTNHSSTVLSICAPAQEIYGAVPDSTDTYTVHSGTSFASPCVAGVVACMLEGYGRLRDRADVKAVKNKLLANATTGVIQHNSTKSLPDKLVYLDPNISFEVIPGLEGIILS